jgi:hypothetical protein
MISIGIVGIYISKIYDEVKGRPVFITDDFDDKKKAEGTRHTIKEVCK